MDDNLREREHDPNYDKFTAGIDKNLRYFQELLEIQTGTLGMSLGERTGYSFDIVLATNILANEDRAGTLDTETTLHEPAKRQELLKQAALLLIHDNNVLPGIDDLVPEYLERYNHLEQRLSDIDGTEPEMLDHDGLESELKKLRTELREQPAGIKQQNPFVKWLGDHTTWRLRP